MRDYMSEDFLELVIKICKAITILLGGLLVFSLIASLVINVPRDDSDSPTARSGMMVLTDHLTDCQYLYKGSLTPRLDAAGKQICGK